ncbi:MAG: hypothetical protein U0893_15385 [Chloroflexota bacterium]
MDEPTTPAAPASTEHADSLEDALAHTEAATERALNAAADLTKMLRRLRGAAALGNLRDLRATIGSVGQAAKRASDEVEAAAESWTLDEEAYLASGQYSAELLEAAQARGLQLFERDERIYCYPVLLRVAAGERSVFVDRARERRIRPSVLVEHLRDVQRRPPRFRPEAFLESLFAAYGYLARRHGPDQTGAGHAEPLIDVYNLMTLAPGARGDYSRQEFARDVYLLDRGGVTTTRRGFVVSFPASTGARSAGSAMRVVTESGQEKVYYSIAFTQGG